MLTFFNANPPNSFCVTGLIAGSPYVPLQTLSQIFQKHATLLQNCPEAE